MKKVFLPFVIAALVATGSGASAATVATQNQQSAQQGQPTSPGQPNPSEQPTQQPAPPAPLPPVQPSQEPTQPPFQPTPEPTQQPQQPKTQHPQNPQVDEPKITSVEDGYQQLTRAFQAKHIIQDDFPTNYTIDQLKELIREVEGLNGEGTDALRATFRINTHIYARSGGTTSALVTNVVDCHSYPNLPRALRDLTCNGQTTYKGHRGYDLVGPSDNAEVTSNVSGVVLGVNRGCPPGWAGNQCGGGAGNYIAIETYDIDGTKMQVGYYHFSQVFVNPGDRVKAGQPIGLQGTSGSSTGPHVHYEVAQRVSLYGSLGLRDPRNIVRNFYRNSIYWDVGDKVIGKYQQYRNVMGATTGPQVCGAKDGGCFQFFENNWRIYWSPKTGSIAMNGNSTIGRFWVNSGSENGRFGYPSSDEGNSARGGRNQRFLNDIIFTSSNGTYAVNGDIMRRYMAINFENSSTGYPVSAMQCGLRNGGCWQQFANGQIHWSPNTGAWETSKGLVHQKWADNKRENGYLGYVSGPEYCNAAGCWQAFEHGFRIYWSAATGAHVVNMSTSIGKTWSSYGDRASRYGYPTTDQGNSAGGGQSQRFAGGIIFSSPRGTTVGVVGGILGKYTALDFERSRLGYPTELERCGLRGGGCTQKFENGLIATAPNRGFWDMTNSAMVSRWNALGATDSKIGYPVGAMICGLKYGGCWQPFQNGNLHWSPQTGAWDTNNGSAINKRWSDTGRERGVFGYPTSSESCDSLGCSQRFEVGMIFSNVMNGTRIIRGAISQRYVNAELKGIWGFPTSDTFLGRLPGDISQVFAKNTTVYATNAVPGAHTSITNSKIRAKWGQLGYEYGRLGFPTSDEVRNPDGSGQASFQRGRIEMTSAGVITVIYY